ncbi:unnamed protein product [marine sediment metagenome]|uniref:Uncharacterized protein n=1 Tax=marine sediment metagenome TaxID=412755 RepID=X0Z2Q3_9ZZZZ
MLTKFESLVITELGRIAKALEVSATCQIEQTQMAKEAIKKSQELYEANMVMIKESKPEIILDKELVKSDLTKI